MRSLAEALLRNGISTTDGNHTNSEASCSECNANNSRPCRL